MVERGPVETHTLFQKAFNAGDLQGLMGLYESDAVLIPQPGAEPVRHGPTANGDRHHPAVE